MNKPADGGWALPSTMILLAGFTAMALGAAAAALAALALAAYQQSALLAFEAAETGVAEALRLAAAQPGFLRQPTQPVMQPAGERASYVYRILPVPAGAGWAEGFSAAGDEAGFGVAAYVAVADGTESRGAAVRIEQGFYLLVPAG